MSDRAKLDDPGEPLAAELVEDAPVGLMATDPDCRVLYANAALRRWTGQETPERLADLLSPASHLYYETQIAPMLRLQGFAREISCKLRSAAGPELPALMNIVLRPAGAGRPERIDFAFFDATERLSAEAELRRARAESDELAAIVRSARVGILRCSEDGRITRLNAAARCILGLGPDAEPDAALDDLLSLEPDGSGWFADAVREIGESGRDQTFEAAAGGRHYAISVARIAAPEAPFAAADYSVILRDITDRIRAERRLKVMVQELNHRIRNIFAVVVGLVRQSVKNSTDERDTLVERLQNLAASHDMLTQNYWKDANLGKIIDRLKGQVEADQLVLRGGPDVRLAPAQFKAVSMALHELATNSRKYGALSVEGGRIELDWASDEAGTFRLEWRERGGPPVTPPTRRGTGSRLIETILAAELGGRAEISFDPEGVHFICEGETHRG